MGDRVLVIGVGNSFRRDDGVGPVVAEWLRECVGSDHDVIEQSGEGASLMQAWEGYRTVILIDASLSGAPAGTIHRLDASVQSIPQEFFHYSTHAFSVAEAVELARALGTLPPRVLLYGIEGGDFGAGTEIAETVLEAGRLVVQEIRGLLAQTRATTQPF